MALIDELKARYARLRDEMKGLVEREEEVGHAMEDLSRAIATLEAPAHPLDELRTVPGAVEEVRDQFTFTMGGVIRKEQGKPSATFACDGRYDSGAQGFTFKAGDEIPQWMLEPGFTWAVQNDGTALVMPTPPDPEPNATPTDITVADLDKLSTKATAEERAEAQRDWRGDYVPTADGGVEYSPEIPEGFTKWEGKQGWPFAAEQDGDQGSLRVTVIYADGLAQDGAAMSFVWEHYSADRAQHIIAYRIISTPDAEPVRHMDEGEQQVTRDALFASAKIITSPAPEGDLWQQGYDDRKNGFDPSLAETDYLKGYEARKAVEDEQAATYERSKFFAEGMMADADRHAQDQRSIVEKIGGVLGFKREREDA